MNDMLALNLYANRRVRKTGEVTEIIGVRPAMTI